MKNNKQDLLTNIRIAMSILNYSDDDLINLYGKTYKQISNMTYDQIKHIFSDLYNKYKGNNKIEEDIDEIDELNNVVMEIRRCLNFFQDETETTLFVEEDVDNIGYLVDEETGNKYKIIVEKIN